MSAVLKCRSVLTRIDALRTTELEGPESHAVEAHLGVCKSCRASVDDVRDLASLLRSSAPAPARSLAEKLAGAVADGVDAFEAGGTSVSVVFSRQGIRRIDLRPGTGDAPAKSQRSVKDGGSRRDLRPAPLPDRARRAIEAALRGERAPRPEIDLSGLTPFEQKVLRTLERIPHGEVRSYEWVAREIGKPKAVRAVGHALATNPVPFLLPCHRVVPASGGIGKYAFGSPLKRSILVSEGAPVAELEALAARHVRYVGSKTTKVFCFPTCKDARRIREPNRALFHDSKEARNDGYRPCRRCAPVVAA